MNTQFSIFAYSEKKFNFATQASCIHGGNSMLSVEHLGVFLQSTFSQLLFLHNLIFGCSNLPS